MLHTCAVGFTRFLYKRCNLPLDRLNVYVYGAELLFSTALAAFSILFISALVGKLFAGILFIIIFVSLRVLVGGFHASTYRNCFLLTNGVFLITLAVSMMLERFETLILAFTLVPSVFTIWMLAPISNPHHPLSREAYKRNKIAGQTLTGIESAISISADLLLAQTDVHVLPITSASFAAVAVMMIIPKIIERRETGHE